MPKPHRYGVYGGEALLGSRCGEPWPANLLGPQVGDTDPRTGVVTVQARTFVPLQLERLQLAGLLGGGGQQVQHSDGVGQQQPDGGHIHQPRAILGELSGQIHHVVVIHQTIGQAGERCDYF